jgi:hypothetical protein
MGAIIQSCITIDQMIANRIDKDPPQSTIALVCEQPISGYHESNFSIGYTSHLCRQSPGLKSIPVNTLRGAPSFALFAKGGISQLSNRKLLRVRASLTTGATWLADSDNMRTSSVLTSRPVEVYPSLAWDNLLDN